MYKYEKIVLWVFGFLMLAFMPDKHAGGISLGVGAICTLIYLSYPFYVMLKKDKK